MNEIKLSIVIPYYKTYDLTYKILKELRNQKNENVEIILIDDGCNEIRLDEFKDIAIIKHLKENGGGARASNTGIEMATGKYIGFIDSDDMISKDYLSTLLNAIDNHKEDVIFMDWQDMNTGEIVHHPNNYAPWKAIYKREITPRFPNGRIFSYDVQFYDDLNKKEYSKYYIDKVLYFYNSNREGNLTTLKEKFRRANMIKCVVLEKFNLEKFNELKNVQRVSLNQNEYGKLYVGDKFECSKEMAKYLTGGNDKGKVVVKIVEVEPEKVVDNQPKEKVEEIKTPLKTETLPVKNNKKKRK